MKVTVIELTSEWLAIRYNNSMIYLLNSKGTYIAVEDVINVPWFMRDVVKSLIRKLKRLKIIEKMPKVESITDEQIPYKSLKIAYQLHYHYGSYRGRELYRYFRSLLNSSSSK
ncbi:hypothetical protein DRJ17_06410 [Candidatus Woesearchaeota archaeon]|nr:MAG: hypothetical protein DRJ17_06410 [Candidatus Woesearchaeota archaeon]